MPGLTEESDTLDAVVDVSNASDSDRNGLIFNITPIDGARCTVIVEDTEGLYREPLGIPIDEAFDTVIGEPNTDIEDKLQDVLYELRIGESQEVTVDTDKLSEADTNIPNNNRENTGNNEDTCDGLQLMESQLDKKHMETVNACCGDKKLCVKLLGFQNPPNVCDYTRSQKFEIAKFHKQAGVDLFKSGKRKLAYRRFSKSLKFLLLMLPKKEISPDLHEIYDQLRTQCYSNMAACLLKEEQYDLVVKNCTRSLDIDQKFVKSLYRRADAYFHLKMLEACKQDIDSGLKLEPNNKAFQQLLKRVNCKPC